MLLKRYESTEVDRRTWLYVPLGAPRSTFYSLVLFWLLTTFDLIFEK